MSIITVVGIDPGLVHTGIVFAHFNRNETVPSITVDPVVVEGDHQAAQVAQVLNAPSIFSIDRVFIEKYRERGQIYTQNAEMRKLESELHAAIPRATFIDNTGSKQIVKRELLDLLGFRNFPRTHHKDLESAATILVYGMLKDDQLNELLFEIVASHLAGRPWPIFR